MQVFLTVINVLLILNAIVLIVSVLMQEGSRQGLGVIAGGAETFFGKSKGKSYEGKLEMITKVGVTTFIIFAIVMTSINARNGISNVSTPPDLTSAPSVSEILDQKKGVLGDGLDTTLPAEEEAEVAAEDAETAVEGTEAAVVADEAAAEPTEAPAVATEPAEAEAPEEPAA